MNETKDGLTGNASDEDEEFGVRRSRGRMTEAKGAGKKEEQDDSDEYV